MVVTTNSGYPLDQNLYQAVKGMSAAAQIVSDGGYIAAAARCNDGFPAHGNFRSCSSAMPRRGRCSTPSRPPASRCTTSGKRRLLAIIRLKARVGLKSEIPADEVRRAHLEPVEDLGAAVAAELVGSAETSTWRSCPKAR